MAGVVLVNANLVRQKAYNAVYGTGKIVATLNSVSPYHFYAVKSFFLHMAANKGNPDLQFIPYAAEDIIANNGYQPIAAGAATLYMWFMKARRTSGTTASFQAIHDAADNSATTTTLTTQLINKTGQSAIFVWPDGFPVATEITISAATAVGGATESTAADATDGFLIVGA
jgi:hypothetical protein